nr:MAG TPA: hypothetical protein [Caudoviricetes sp.]
MTSAIAPDTMDAITGETRGRIRTQTVAVCVCEEW